MQNFEIFSLIGSCCQKYLGELGSFQHSSRFILIDKKASCSANNNQSRIWCAFNCIDQHIAGFYMKMLLPKRCSKSVHNDIKSFKIIGSQIENILFNNRNDFVFQFRGITNDSRHLMAAISSFLQNKTSRFSCCSDNCNVCHSIHPPIIYDVKFL
ncbi:hypothetical protein D3C78_1352720 [compost metagenome]